ncbi:cyclin-like protein [Hypoxylon cercidicola]|nr:cyclin-like protein [Hypoxylon cercidicola]
MDAKPYRPAFAAIHRGNENLPPVTGKTLHQRHKSTSSLLGAIPNQSNIPVKRNGLNDIKTGLKPAVSRDGPMPAKITGYPGGAVAVAQENRGAISKDAFLQPAQRPSKAIIPAASMNNIRSVAQDLLPKPLSKQLTKRNAPIAVYNDNQPDKDMPNTHLEAAKSMAQQFSTYGTKFQSVGQGWTIIESQQAPLEGRLHGFHMENPQLLSQPQSNDSHSTASQAVQPSLTHRVEDDVTEPLFLDAVEDLPNDNYPALVPKKPENWEPMPEGWESGLSHSPTSVEGQTVEIKPSDLQAPRPSSVPIDDQADLSDYEDDEYDDQGYTTAHSVRDNTTGGVTTVMVPPKLTKKGIAEIAAAKEIVESQRADADPDDDESWDISMVIEYGDEIFQYMKEVEMALMPNAHYMDIQTELKWSMRSVLIDWVVQVHSRFGLLPETLFLAVNFIDRFLSLKIVSLNKLQLVGATALLLAAKYEEINCPSVQEIVYMVDGGYTIQEVIKAERFMLCMLNFELGWPGPMSFIRRISKADDYDNEIRTVAKYFLEVATMDERFVGSPPSYLAAGAQCLSRMILEKGDWTPAHVHYSGYTYSQLKPLIATLLDCCRIARKHHSAVFEKYSLKQFKRAATYVEGQIMQGFCLPFEQNIRYQLPEFFDGYPEPHAITMPIPIIGQ